LNEQEHRKHREPLPNVFSNGFKFRFICVTKPFFIFMGRVQTCPEHWKLLIQTTPKEHQATSTTTWLFFSSIVLFLTKMTMVSFTLGRLTWVRISISSRVHIIIFFLKFFYLCFSGLRSIGFNIVASFILSIVINTGLSYPTQPVSHSW